MGRSRMKDTDLAKWITIYYFICWRPTCISNKGHKPRPTQQTIFKWFVSISVQADFQLGTQAIHSGLTYPQENHNCFCSLPAATSFDSAKVSLTGCPWIAAVCQKQEEVLVTRQAVLSKYHEQETMPDIQLPLGFNRRGLSNLGNHIMEHGAWVFRRSAD